MSGNTIVYLDCYSGISGDMLLGALVDCGVEPAKLEQLLRGLKLEGYRLQVQKVTLYGLAGTRVQVRLLKQDQHCRHLSDILELIDAASLPARVKEESAAVFRNLAGAEAAVHGVSEEEVHFHEVGAVDAIVDVVGSLCALHLLGVKEIWSSPLPVGRGMTCSAHGKIPLPAPATLELLRRRNAPLYGQEITGELVTPTGAAIVTTLAKVFGPPPLFVPSKIGYGAGTADPGYPNFLRVLHGTAVRPAATYEEKILILEVNIDDLNPEIYGYLMEKLLANGALDVYFTPIQMKKNRPAVKLSVLTGEGQLAALTDIVFQETSTLGLRIIEGRKIMRPRETVKVETPWGPVRIKMVSSPTGDGTTPHAAPEYDDCREIALRTGIPLKEIFRRVEEIFQKTILLR